MEVDDWGGLQGDVFAFDGVQISGTQTVTEPRGEDWSFRARSTTIIRPLVRTEGDILRRELTEVGGRFAFRGVVVVGIMEHVDYRIRSSATYTRADGRSHDCSYNPPTRTTRLGMMMWREVDRPGRIAVRYTAYSGGWACRDVVFGPTCATSPGQADVSYYRDVELTRRWIKLPIDLQFRTGNGVICEQRFHGFVRLKKLRDGEK